MINNILKNIPVDGIKHLYIDNTILDTVPNDIYPSLHYRYLYDYQYDVVNAILEHNVFVSAPTGSGKTLSFALAYARMRESSPEATMLVIYPRKALARDQMLALSDIFGHIPHMETVKIMAYDGDVSSLQKREALLGADVIVSNFYGIHVYLANHGAWARFLSKLSLVVIDETHLYSGVFGTHVSYVIRRLRRLASLYGAAPKFLLLSATVSEPDKSGELLVGLPFVSVEVPGLSMYSKDLYFLTTSSGKERRLLISLVQQLIDYGYRGMVFFNSREEMERIYYAMKGSEYGDEVAPYRAGYDADERRRIESAMRSGDISFLLTTSAMELGIDIGDIDVTILYGFPTTGFSSFWQRVGRSGRKSHGYVFTVLKSSNALDMYIYDHPEIVLARRGEPLHLDITNMDIGLKQIKCAIWEYPLKDDMDGKYFPREVIDVFVEQNKDKLVDSDKGMVLLDAKPHHEVSLDEGDSVSFHITDEETGNMIEKVQMWRVLKKHYPGSTYFYMGKSYVVELIDLEKKFVGVKPVHGISETMPVGWEDIRVIDIRSRKIVGRRPVYEGVLEIESYTVGYSDKTGVYLYNAPLYRKFLTKGVWFDVYRDDLEVSSSMFHLHIPMLGTASITTDEIFAGSLHALEHILINVLPLISISPDDVGGYSIPSIYKHIIEEIEFAPLVYVEEKQQFPNITLDVREQARVYIYDSHPGGVGIAERIYEKFEDIVVYAARRLDDCTCKKGCPACIMSHQCGNGNRPLNKLGSRSLLRTLFLV